MNNINELITDFKKSLIEALERADLPAPSEAIKQYKNVSGIYVWYDRDGRIRYIGKGNPLATRIKRHMGSIGKGNSSESAIADRSMPHRNLAAQGKEVPWDFFQKLQLRVLPIATEADRVYIESVLITEFRPDANIRAPNTLPLGE